MQNKEIERKIEEVFLARLKKHISVEDMQVLLDRSPWRITQAGLELSTFAQAEREKQSSPV